MLRAIARALAAAATAVGKGLDKLGDLAISPFQALFGSGGGGGRLPPEFDPSVSALDLLDKVAKSADEAKPVPGISQLDRDGVSTVAKYASASPAARKSYDLSGLRKEVRMTLLTMSDAQLEALAKARINQARLFVTGQDHGVPGVPVVGAPIRGGSVSAPMTSPEELRERVRAALAAKKGGSKPFAMPRLP